MSKDRLVVEQDHHGAHLIWFLADEDDFGADVGDGFEEGVSPWETFQQSGTDLDTLDARIWWEAVTLAKKDIEEERAFYAEGAGIRWESVRRAREVLREAKRKAKLWLKGSENWPKWAQTALEAGWKPPKGWAP